MRNVYWFLLDGLSPKHLKSCGGNQKYNYIDSIIDGSVVFTNVASTAAGTHNSMHSIFTSLLPSVNGAMGFDVKALRKFTRESVTLTDLFYSKGYHTLRYDDCENEREVPKSGFEVWESGGMSVGEFRGTEKTKDCERRRLFFSRVKATKSPKFMYYHMGLFHDINGKLGRIWPSESYDRNILVLAEELKKVIEDLEISDDDVIVLSSDHGCVLDRDWQKDCLENGERHYEESVTTFFSIKNTTLPPKKINKLISSLDEALTLYEFLFGEKMFGQGVSRLVDVYKEVSVSEAQVFREKVSPYSHSGEILYKSECFYVRDNDWKYVYSINDPRSEWLINLKEGDYIINRKEEFPEKVAFYNSLIKDTFLNIETVKNNIYETTAQIMNKKKIPYVFAVVVKNCTVSQEDYDYLCDLGGAYYKIVFVDCNVKFDKLNMLYFTEILEKEKLSEIKMKSKYMVELYCLENVPEQLLSDVFCLFNDTGANEIIDFGYGRAYLSSNEIHDAKTKIVKIRDRYDLAVKNELGKYDHESMDISIKTILNNIINKYNSIAIYGNGKGCKEFERIIGYRFADYIIDKKVDDDSRCLSITEMENVDIECIINSVWSARYDIESDIKNSGYSGEYIDIYKELCREGLTLIYPFFEYGNRE